MQEAKLLLCFTLAQVAKVTLARMLVEWKIIYFQQKLGAIIQRFVRPKLFKKEFVEQNLLPWVPPWFHLGSKPTTFPNFC